MTTSPVLRGDSIVKELGSGAGLVMALKGVSLELVPGRTDAADGPVWLRQDDAPVDPRLHHEADIRHDPTGRHVHRSVFRPKSSPKVRRDHIGFIFQSYNLFPTLSALENVRIALDVRGIKGFAATSRAEEVLREVGLGHRLTNYPSNLSGGEQQRVAVARAIASSPSIVLADEPTAALDGENGHAVMALLARIAKEQNRSVLAVTHDPRTLGYADRVVRIEDGKIVGEERRPEGINAPEITDLTKRRKLHA